MLPTRIIHSNTLATELRIDVSPSEVLSEGLLSVFVMLESSITKAGVRAEKRKDFKRIAIINAPPYNINICLACAEKSRRWNSAAGGVAPRATAGTFDLTYLSRPWPFKEVSL